MRNRRLSYKANVTLKAQFGIERMEVRQPSLVDEFYHEKSTCPDTGVEVTSYHHPLYMLFNQERLNRLGDGAVQQWLKSLDNANNAAYNNIKSQLTDKQLLQLVKSRNVQSPTELENWLNYLNERADAFNKEVAEIVAKEKEQQEQQQQQQQQPTNVESTPNT